MATSEVEAFVCPICMEPVDDQKLLPCLHSFCLECLHEYCKVNGYHPDDVVSCPVCRIEFKIPNDGVQQFLTKPLNDKCPRHVKNDLDIYCSSCEQFVCGTCKNVHHDVKAHHPLQDVDSVRTQMVKLSKVVESRINEITQNVVNLDERHRSFQNDLEAIENESQEAVDAILHFAVQTLNDIKRQLNDAKEKEFELFQVARNTLDASITELRVFDGDILRFSRTDSVIEAVVAHQGLSFRGDQLLRKDTNVSGYQEPTTPQPNMFVKVADFAGNQQKCTVTLCEFLSQRCYCMISLFQFSVSHFPVSRLHVAF